MKRRYAALLGVALLAPVAGRAQLLPGLPPLVPLPPAPLVPTACGPLASGPFALVRVGAVCTNLSNLISFDALTGLYGLRLAAPVVVGTGRLNSLNVTYKQDPYISFGVGTSNLTAGPTAYTFYFGQAITPDTYTRATSTAGVTVTSGDAGSATVAQNGTDPFISIVGTSGTTAYPLGVNIGTGTCTAGLASNNCRYPAPSGGPAQNNFAPLFLDNLEVTLTYTQTDANSQVGWTGRADVLSVASIQAVPEPATVGLVAVGIVGVLGVARRRRTAG